MHTMSEPADRTHIAERAAAESLALPVYGELTAAQQDTVVTAVGRFVEQNAGVAR